MIATGPLYFDSDVRNMEIKTVEFNDDVSSLVQHMDKGTNWPVVYIIHNDNEVYVGETCNVSTRLQQHRNNQERRRLKLVELVLDDTLNKSATLDIEQSLIRLYSAEEELTLQNMNGGQSPSHDYYNRARYTEMVGQIWKELCANGSARTGYSDLVNNALFKFSPYTALTEEQTIIKGNILSDIVSHADDDNHAIIVRGSAGTGKTLLGLSLLKTLASIPEQSADLIIDNVSTAEEITAINRLHSMFRGGKLKVAMVVPMDSLRNTLRKVAKKSGLPVSMIKGPSEVIDSGPYDVLIVDEAHRLSCYRNISYMGSFKNRCEQLGLDPKTSSQLDWIRLSSRCQILFYDKEQSIKKADITDDQFLRTVGDDRSEFILTSQMRCLGGESYVDYVKAVLDCRGPERLQFGSVYGFRIFDDVQEMVDVIKEKDSSETLCRVVAGYSWEWATKNLHIDASKVSDDSSMPYDIDIDGHHFVWNNLDDKEGKEWITNPRSVHEIGCVHTTQGYDLNYVGVIFGKEIDYDPEENRIVVDPKLLKDMNVKKGCTVEEVREFVINSYKVMMTRGIRGCYVYACNPNLAKYLRRYIPV